MPEYQNLDGSSGWSWRSLTSLERRLIILSTILAILCCGFIIAYVASCSAKDHPEPTTPAPNTTITTPLPTNITTTTLKPSPTNATVPTNATEIPTTSPLTNATTISTTTTKNATTSLN